MIEEHFASSEKHYRAYGLTDTGLSRSHNEDSFSVDVEQGLFIVADGMGGHQGGEVASRMVAEQLSASIPELLSHHPQPASREQIAKALSQSIQIVNKNVMLAGQELDLQGMGSTVVMALVHGSFVFVGHIGDSRAYLVRAQQIRRLTKDHSLVAELVRTGQISEEQARVHPYRNIVTKAIGTTGEVHSELAYYASLPGDILILCTDGLNNMIPDESILEVALEVQDPESIALELVHRALAAGGKDNVTVVVVRWEDEE